MINFIDPELNIVSQNLCFKNALKKLKSLSEHVENNILLKIYVYIIKMETKCHLFSKSKPFFKYKNVLFKLLPVNLEEWGLFLILHGSRGEKAVKDVTSIFQLNETQADLTRELCEERCKNPVKIMFTSDTRITLMRKEKNCVAHALFEISFSLRWKEGYAVYQPHFWVERPLPDKLWLLEYPVVQ